MSPVHEVDLALRPIERAEYSLDAIAGVAKDVPSVPLMQTVDDEIADDLGHALARFWDIIECSTLASQPGSNRGPVNPRAISGTMTRPID
jgi:hypothetical protein